MIATLFDVGTDLVWSAGSIREANALLAGHHYLGPINRARHVFLGRLGTAIVACQVWVLPSSRHLPLDGSWLELARWCLTPEAGEHAGSRMHRFVTRWLRDHAPAVSTLVSYSDPSQGHTGALYRACNWAWAPTWQRLRPPPSGGGSWDGVTRQSVKDRWVFALRPDAKRGDVLRVTDAGALRAFVPIKPYEHRWLAGVAA